MSLGKGAVLLLIGKSSKGEVSPYVIPLIPFYVLVCIYNMYIACRGVKSPPFQK